MDQKNKVKFYVQFRGREMAYQDMGRKMLQKVIDALEDIADVEAPIKMEGRRMTLMMTYKN